jgi:hypothetical protein
MLRHLPGHLGPGEDLVPIRGGKILPDPGCWAGVVDGRFTVLGLGFLDCNPQTYQPESEPCPVPTLITTRSK